MPIQVPRGLNRFAPVAPAPNSRINAQAPDLARGEIQKTNAVEGLVSSAALSTESLIREDERQQAHTIAIEKENQYISKKQADLRQLSVIEGDPTKAFVNFRGQDQKDIDSFTSSDDDDLSELAKNSIKRRLRSASQKVHLKADAEEFRLGYEFRKNTTEASADLKAGEVVEAAAMVTLEDETSFIPFNSAINDVIDVRVSDSYKDGLISSKEEFDINAGNFKLQGNQTTGKQEIVFEKENGDIVKLKVHPSVSLDLQKDLSKSIFNSVQVMFDAGQVEEGKLIREKFKMFMDPFSNNRLSKNLESSEVEQEAFALVNQLKGASPEVRLSTLRKVKNPKVVKEANKFLNDISFSEKVTRERNSDISYQKLFTGLAKKGYNTLSEAKLDPSFKPLMRQITNPTDIKAIEEMYNPPDVSTLKATNKMQNLIFGQDPNYQLDNIPPEKFNSYLLDLSKKDRTKYSGIYEKANTDSESEKRTRFSSFEKQLEDELRAVKYIKDNNFGKLSNEEKVKLATARSELIEQVGKLNKVLDPDEVTAFVKRFARAKKINSRFNLKPEELERFKGVDSQEGDSLQKTEPQLMELYRQKNGRYPNKQSKNWKNFLESQKGK